MGFKLTGMYDVVFANDVSEVALTTYSKNFDLKMVRCRNGVAYAERGVALVCDVRNVVFWTLSGEVDVVVGGPPCQDFSVARGRHRPGIEGSRGSLYVHMVRALAVLQPKAFVFENVPGLASVSNGLAYSTILRDFSTLNIRSSDALQAVLHERVSRSVKGYEIVFSGTVDFSSLGVPQRRVRLIIIGIRRDLLRPGEVSEVREAIEKALYTPLFRKYPLTPLEAFEGRRLDELQEKYREIMEEWRGVWEEVGTARAYKWKQEVWDRLTLDVVEDYLRLNESEYGPEFEEALKLHEEVLSFLGYYGKRVSELAPPDSTNEVPRVKPEVADRLRRIPPGENHEFVRGTAWEVEGRGISIVYRRLHPLKPAYTVVAYGGGGTYGYHYERGRTMLTLRELARLQTFPDQFLFHGSRTQIRAQIGEAVPPLGAVKLAETLGKILRNLG